ncbi:ion channel [Winogradskyella poriferorum]|uniref:ion channel n=1 Tax=Winogradskyella poriferorum TaxID=307627 RepID=UPI003D661E5B
MLNRLFPYRFELYLASQLLVLFGSLIIPNALYENFAVPLFMMLNLIFGLVLVSHNSYIKRVSFGLVILTFCLILFQFIDTKSALNNIKLGAYFMFYSIVTVEIIRQVWKAQIVSKNVILGLISGYISLGLLAFFLCLTIEIIYPGSFSGITNFEGTTNISEPLMYYAYITLMTIGYGDIIPQTGIAQKASIFIGLIGQFYLVVLTAIVVGKYINQSHSKNN